MYNVLSVHAHYSKFHKFHCQSQYNRKLHVHVHLYMHHNLHVHESVSISDAANVWPLHVNMA